VCLRSFRSLVALVAPAWCSYPLRRRFLCVPLQKPTIFFLSNFQILFELIRHVHVCMVLFPMCIHASIFPKESRHRVLWTLWALNWHIGGRASLFTFLCCCKLIAGIVHNPALGLRFPGFTPVWLHQPNWTDQEPVVSRVGGCWIAGAEAT
jgi:hypothetical protein